MHHDKYLERYKRGFLRSPLVFKETYHCIRISDKRVVFTSNKTSPKYENNIFSYNPQWIWCLHEERYRKLEYLTLNRPDFDFKQAKFSCRKKHDLSREVLIDPLCKSLLHITAWFTVLMPTSAMHFFFYKIDADRWVQCSVSNQRIKTDNDD